MVRMVRYCDNHKFECIGLWNQVYVSYGVGYYNTWHLEWNDNFVHGSTDADVQYRSMTQISIKNRFIASNVFDQIEYCIEWVWSNWILRMIELNIALNANDRLLLVDVLILWILT